MSLRQIYPNKDPSGMTTIDIIAVHGFDSFDTSGSCSASSWCEPSGQPGDWLVEFIRTHNLEARLLLYEYKSNITLRTDAGSLSRQADCLLLQISNERSTTDPHTPLIFLCHGLGGILVKQALVNASQNDHYRGIKTATRGLAFFGTPHQVPLQRSPSIIEKTLSFVSLAKPIQSPYDLELLSVQGFRDQIEDYRFISFYGDSDDVSVALQLI
ncbi:hypothetical protein IFM53868_09897 [Aspergillus udagawae]|uniref:Protein SERAC1 n=1 Tax=Aspergillus udagawae TaxID=91492 RepID=A0ABQ1BCS1_9EURO|nr:hypothetical protein IFM53868_09897 [Aspergillus udagawae]